jgi:DNA-directed RNA polymerase, beta'' subunit/160 kD subunit
MALELEIKRKLTREEIDDILDELTVDGDQSWETAMSVLEKIRLELYEQLKNQELYPCQIPAFKQEILKMYYTSKVNPGESVGVMASSSISETNTQNTLNSFHYSGISSFGTANMGMSRLNELMNLSKKQKFSTVTLKLAHPTPSLIETRKICRKNFEEKYLSQFISDKSVQIFFLRHKHLTESEQQWYLFFDTVLRDSEAEYSSIPWSIRLNLSKDMLLRYETSLEELSKTIEREYQDCVCVWSPDYIGIIDVYIKTDSVDCPSALFDLLKQKKIVKIASCKSDMSLMINDSNKNYFYLRDVVLDQLLNIKVSGVSGIQQIGYQKKSVSCPPIGTPHLQSASAPPIQSVHEWEISTLGTNLIELLTHPLVDFRTTTSNNVWEIFDIFGIEATRTFLINAFKAIISSGSVDPSHLKLLVDSMTFRGIPSSVSRYGINRNETGPLTKASFEQSSDNMAIAAFRGEVETINNISSSVILGKMGNLGTGMVDVRVDINKLIQYKNEQPKEIQKEDFPEIDLEKMIVDGVY